MSLWAVRRLVHFLGRAGSSGIVSMNTSPRALRANLLRARPANLATVEPCFLAVCLHCRDTRELRIAAVVVERGVGAVRVQRFSGARSASCRSVASGHRKTYQPVDKMPPARGQYNTWGLPRVLGPTSCGGEHDGRFCQRAATTGQLLYLAVIPAYHKLVGAATFGRNRARPRACAAQSAPRTGQPLLSRRPPLRPPR